MLWQIGHLSQTRFSKKAHQKVLFQISLLIVEAKPVKS